MSELEALILKAGKGEQNRYGDIEYTYTENERCMFITQLSHSLQHTLPNLHEQEGITSLIYWSILGTPKIASSVFTHFLPLISEPYVRLGFFRFCEENNTPDSKLRHVEILLNFSLHLPKSDALLTFQEELFRALNEIDVLDLSSNEMTKLKQLTGLLLT